MAKINKVFGNNKKITMTSGAILAAFVAGSAFGDTTSESTTLEPLEYQGDSNDLKEAKVVMGSNLSALLEIEDENTGFIYEDDNKKNVLTGANVVIDYSEGTAPKFVIGGYSNNGSEVHDNKVILKQGDIDGPVYGGLSHDINIGDNKIGPTWSSNGKISQVIEHKMKDKTIVANNNAIKVHEPNTNIRSLTGGLAYMNVTSGNVSTGGDISASIHANSFAYNRVIAENLTLFASSNKIQVGESVNVGEIIGGQSTLRIKAGTATAHNTYGPTTSNAGSESTARAKTISLSANNNEVQTGVGVSMEKITGGYATLSIETNTATSGIASGNGINTTFSFTNATAENISLSADNNKIKIASENTVNDSVIGGEASLHIQTSNTEAKEGKGNNNANASTTVKYTNDNSQSFFSANKNVVEIDQKSTVNGSITGGYINLGITTGNAKGGKSKIESKVDSSIEINGIKLYANENNVTFGGILANGDDIIGGAINIELKAGSATYYDDSTGEKTNNEITTKGVIIEATGNTVTLNKNAKINNSATSLYGGKLTYNSDEGYDLPNIDLFTGNTLNMLARPVKVQNVENFENYQFTIYPELANSKKAQLTAANIIFGTNDDNFTSDNSKNSTVEVVGIHSGKRLRAGDTFILMQATDSMIGDASGSESTDVEQVQQGISFLYNVKTDVDLSGKNVTATILGCKDDSKECVIPPDENVNPQLKALSESRLSALTQITRGTDAFAYDVFDVMNTQADIETVNGGFFHLL